MMKYCKSLVVKARPALKNRMRFHFSKRKNNSFLDDWTTLCPETKENETRWALPVLLTLAEVLDIYRFYE